MQLSGTHSEDLGRMHRLGCVLEGHECVQGASVMHSVPDLAGSGSVDHNRYGADKKLYIVLKNRQVTSTIAMRDLDGHRYYISQILGTYYTRGDTSIADHGGSYTHRGGLYMKMIVGGLGRGVKGKYVRSGCTTALNVVPWETDGESVLREAMTNTQTPPHATTVVIPTSALTTNTVANHAERPEKFNEDASSKKFVVARFLDYKMVDSKHVISQVQDLQVEFKNYLKHKRKEMSVEDLVVHLRIEEDNKLAQKDTYAPDSAKANMVEHAGSSSRSNSKGKGKDKKKNDKKGKGKSEYLAPKAGIVKQKFHKKFGCKLSTSHCSINNTQ
ncbi:hypothetical protein Tco_0157437 [Tanacetum coccineum]